MALSVLGCTQAPRGTESEELVHRDQQIHLTLQEQERVFHILATEKDPSLELYRDAGVSRLVERFFIDLTGSEKISRPILRYADLHDISLFLAFSVAYVESRFNPQAVNRNITTVDRGVFQLNSGSFPKLRERDFFDPDISAKYGVSHLRFCLDRGGNEIAALAMYNAGHNRVTSRGAPLNTLRYIDRYVEYRTELSAAFGQYIREKMWEKELQAEKTALAGRRIDTMRSEK